MKTHIHPPPSTDGKLSVVTNLLAGADDIGPPNIGDMHFGSNGLGSDRNRGGAGSA